MKREEFTQIRPSSFYMVVNGKLTYLSVKKVEYMRDADTNAWLGTIYAEDADANKVTIKQDALKGFPKRYRTAEGFENDNDTVIDEMKLLDCTCFYNAGNARVTGDGFLQYWVMKNGDPNFVSQPINHFLLVFNGKFWHYMLSEDTVPPADSYSSREDLLSWSDWIEKDKDGKEVLHRGINKLIMLDDDQRELVEQFKGLLDQMKKQQISVIVSTCDDVTVFNTRNLKSWYMETCPDDLMQQSDEEIDPNKCKAANIYADPFSAGSIPVWSDDYGLYAVPKDEENKNADGTAK